MSLNLHYTGDDVQFRGQECEWVITEHALERMILRGLPRELLKVVLETGVIKSRAKPGGFWVFKEFAEREDNLICASVQCENRTLIVITVLVNWRPDHENSNG
jgi:hypothetical protein